MATNYQTIRNIRLDVPHLDRWASARETHIAVAAAIHAIADSRRAAETIWASPTVAERDHVHMAVDEYVRTGQIEGEPDGRYAWGAETVVMEG